ncbi:metallophosphoesterase family protein [Clostridium sp. AM58-1XD]|uniref:metallophosphoesterase family protein n=1 Tax=Clostridium sp. AM58-1XD TaxID=2292307 RepID=UPI000E4B89C6|nr:metallophosphoesterase family protein [Clostridium sp. AM58-1XD]RGY99093.1 metallophosphoesterase [Clostridium sp. AM58-1XD]
MGSGIHRIGVISDTHGLIRDEVRERLSTCEVILHGGDLNRKDVLNELEKIADVHAVRGNNDGKWAAKIPEKLCMELFGLKLFMTHDKKQLPDDLTPYDLVIYGHSHKYEEINENGKIILNPGSCGPRRFHLPVTMALIEVSDEEWNVERIDLACDK